MKVFRQNLDTINALLAKPTTATGAYAMGIISVLAENDRIVAQDEMLELAAKCQTDFYMRIAEGRKEAAT